MHPDAKSFYSHHNNDLERACSVLKTGIRYEVGIELMHNFKSQSCARPSKIPQSLYDAGFPEKPRDGHFFYVELKMDGERLQVLFHHPHHPHHPLIQHPSPRSLSSISTERLYYFADTPQPQIITNPAPGFEDLAFSVRPKSHHCMSPRPPDAVRRPSFRSTRTGMSSNSSAAAARTTLRSTWSHLPWCV
jgi:hypothetical protein